MNSDTHRYDDMLDLPRHVSSVYPHMSMSDRAAQFSPFAALSGYDGVIRETARLTDERHVLEEEELLALDRKLRMLAEKLRDEPQIAITYFKADAHKDGGAYLEVTGTVRKLDSFERTITLWDGTKIPMDDICGIEGDIFAALE